MNAALILRRLGRLTMAAALAVAAASGDLALAQSTPPPLPSLTAEQTEHVNQAVALYRADTEARVGRGEITPDEAELLIAWRQWQLAQQVTGQVPPPAAPEAADRPPMVAAPYPYAGRPAYVAPYYAAPYYPAPYYPAPYYGPYYALPAPYYWGFSVCGGRGYRHGWASFCI